MTSPAVAQLAVKIQRDVLTPLSDQSAPLVQVKKSKFVPVLPVRYALGIDDSKTPEVTAPFQVTDTNGKAMPKSGKMHYTLRRLRSGYLHIYSEKDQDWFSFLARPEGGELQLLKAPAKYHKSQSPNGPSANAAQDSSTGTQTNECPQPPPLKTSAAGMLLIPDDYPVWLAFSDVMWTDKIFTDFKKQDLREKHMRKFDPKGWNGAWAGQKHVAPLKDAAQRVADLMGYTRSGPFINTISKDAFWFSRDTFLRMKIDVLDCMQVSPKTVVDPKIMERGAFLALDDPAGIAMDLALLMIGRYQNWTNEKDPIYGDANFSRRLTASSSIEMLRGAVATQAVNEAIYIERGNARGIYNQVGEQSVKQLGDKWVWSEKNVMARLQAEVPSIRKKSWDKYLPCYAEDRRQWWEDQIKPHKDELNKNVIIPLAETHLAWMKSERMIEYFKVNFDTDNLESGTVYTRTVELCLSGIQDKDLCSKYLYDSLKGTVDDPKNVVLRALVLNQDKIAKKLASAVAGKFSLKDLPWDQIFLIYSKAVERAKEQCHDVLSRFLIHVGGPVAKIVADVSKTETVLHVLAALGAISQKPIVRVTLTGSKEALQKLLIRKILEQCGGAGVNKQSVKELDKAVEVQLDLLKAHGVNTDGSLQTTWLLVLDTDHIKSMKPELDTVEKQAAYLAQAINTPEKFNEMELAAWRRQVSARLPLVMQVVSLYVSYGAMTKASDDLDKSMSQEMAQNARRYGASVGALVGTISSSLSMLLQKVPRFTLSLGKGISSTSMAMGLEVVGETLGLAGGLYIAYLDTQAGREEYKNKHYGLMLLYYGSAAIGTAASLAFFVGWLGTTSVATSAAGGTALAWVAGNAAAATGVGLLLILIAVGIGLAITNLKPDKIQEWLKRCCFGTSGDLYPNFSEETKQFQLATQG